MSEEFKKKAMDIAVEVAKSAARSFHFFCRLSMIF